MDRKIFEDIIKHPILEKYKNLLWKFADSRIMAIGFSEEHNDFFVMECCDEYYEHTLTKDECLSLSNFFKEIAEIL